MTEQRCQIVWEAMNERRRQESNSSESTFTVRLPVGGEPALSNALSLSKGGAKGKEK